jgi:hypothetical protein
MDEILLSRKIESAYNEILETSKKINILSATIDQLKETTADIIDKYLKALDQSKLEETRNNSHKALEKMMSEIDKVETLISEFEYTKLTLEEGMSNFSERVKSLDESIKKNKSAFDDIDKKLFKHMKQAEIDRKLGTKRLQDATKVMQVKEEIERFDQLLKIEKENNRLLREIQKSISEKTTTSSTQKPTNNN